MSTLLYPATVLMEVRASMLWAREIRGMPSRVRLMQPVSRSFFMGSRFTGAAGCRKVIRYCPSRSMSLSCLFTSLLNRGSFTLRMTSALAKTSSAPSTMVAPAATYSSSEKNEPSPAVFCTSTVAPSATIFFTVSGVEETRPSPGMISLGTPMVIPENFMDATP